MSYTDQNSRSSPASIAAVVGVHLAIGYALVSGLAYTVIRQIPIVTIGQFLDDPPPPPPHVVPVERSLLPKTVTVVPQPEKADPFKAPDVIVPLYPIGAIAGPPTGGGAEIQAQPPLAPNLARGLMPGTDRLRWITTDDYPTAALRQGIAGTVAISAMIGPDGRVRSCAVTASSGSPLLDEATCRLYTRRAHFTPALDAEGNPTAARRADRFRWQIPD